MIFCAIHSQHSESRSTCDKKLLLARDANAVLGLLTIPESSELILGESAESGGRVTYRER